MVSEMKIRFLLLLLITAVPAYSNQALEGLVKDIEAKKQRNEALREHLSKFKVFNIDDYDENSIVKYEVISDSKPKIDEIFAVYMGDPMVEQRVGYYADCITPRIDIKKKIPSQVFTAKANIPICKESNKDKKFIPKYENFEAQKEFKVIKVSAKQKKDYVQFCWHYGPFASCSQKLSPEKIDVGLGFVSLETGLQKRIEYAGKSGQKIKFVYSEYSDGYARAPFMREFEIDLTEGTTVAYKGMIFEIVSADNAMIKYKVIRHFR